MLLSGNAFSSPVNAMHERRVELGTDSQRYLNPPFHAASATGDTLLRLESLLMNATRRSLG